MIPSIPEVGLFRLPLANAGETVIRQRTGYFHLWQFEYIDTGLQCLDGVVNVVFGGQSVTDDSIPFGYNSRAQFSAPVELVTLRWVAQPNIRAVFLIGPSANGLEANNIPAKQLVFQGQAPAFTSQAIAVGTVATTLLAANPNRQRIIIQAPVSNPAQVFIGPIGVTLGSGIILDPGASFIGQSSGEYRAIAAAVGNNLRVMEERA